MRVVEIFKSIEGEGKRAGLPCTFVRFFGCNLRCNYCDTPYGWDSKYEDEATEMSVDEIATAVFALGCPAVTLTGGEPLLQPREEFLDLITALSKKKYIINIESNGSLRLTCHSLPTVFYTLDYKTGSSGMTDKMNIKALQELTDKDVLKFVVGSLEDCVEAHRVIEQYQPCAQIYFSPVFGKIQPADIVDYLLEHNLYHCHVQVQLHKVIWDPNRRGV